MRMAAKFLAAPLLSDPARFTAAEIEIDRSRHRFLLGIGALRQQVPQFHRQHRLVPAKLNRALIIAGTQVNLGFGLGYREQQDATGNELNPPPPSSAGGSSETIVPPINCSVTPLLMVTLGR